MPEITFSNILLDWVAPPSKEYKKLLPLPIKGVAITVIDWLFVNHPLVVNVTAIGFEDSITLKGTISEVQPKIERLVTVKDKEENKDITENFCRRVSCLIAISHSEIDEWHRKAKKVYKLRSNFVHGSQSIYKTYETELGFDPFQLACPTILSACILFYKLGLELSPYEEKLKNIYFELSEICEDEKYKMKKVMNS